jgi:hypothetical protein
METKSSQDLLTNKQIEINQVSSSLLTSQSSIRYSRHLSPTGVHIALTVFDMTFCGWKYLVVNSHVALYMNRLQTSDHLRRLTSHTITWQNLLKRRNHGSQPPATGSTGVHGGPASRPPYSCTPIRRSSWRWCWVSPARRRPRTCRHRRRWSRGGSTSQRLCAEAADVVPAGSFHPWRKLRHV